MSLPNAPLPFSAANADFVAEIYQQYLLNPSSVDPSWASFFRELNDDARTLGLEVSGPSWSKNPPLRFIGNDNIIEKPAAKAGKPAAAPAPAGGASPDPATIQAAARDSVRALMLIRAYRTIGHMQANLDPLGLTPPPQLPELQPEHYGFAPSDYDRPIYIDGVLGLTQTTLRDILAKLQATYCGSIGFEFMHLLHAEEKGWLQERIEAPRPNLSREYRISALSRLTAAEAFEKFLQIKFVGTKRFGLEGGEAMIPAIEAMIDQGTRLGLREVVVGMAHRGRLNMLTNVLGKPFTKMFAEFQGQPAYPDSVQGSGDVKYHMGTSVDRDFGGHTVHLTMNANPSHLEFVNPVVVGRVRAKQQQISGSRRVSDDAMRAVCALLIHGDAAFAGQGVVPETLMLSELRGYRTGGTIHFVINNQVGFTTSPNYSRSGVYCSDVAKMIQAPILHVNGDDVEAVLFAANLAIEYRQRFMHDMVIDMVCYRRHGHNESDEPAFTQPVMYKQIRQQPTTRERYAQKLAAEGSVSMAESDKIQRDFMERLEADFQASKNYKPNKADWLEGKWLGLQATSDDRDGKTGVADHTLREVGAALGRVPDNFDVNPKVAKQMDARREMIDTGQGIDWATAEALAFGTLLLEGTPVRLSGQDCGRGTFSQRHSVLHDQSSEKKFVPLNNIRPDQTCEFDVHDSPLSECAVMGFDYGFTLAEPNALVCWEGQFGDFANGAQVIIDQFISSAETKWLRLSGLTLLLPHGYEGQGPEHSSARLERYLQLCAEDNMSVANCSTPANYFHILRRQVRRNFRKPLVLMTPKSLLRHKLCVSSLKDFTLGTIFQRVMGEADSTIADSKVRRVVLCSGKVYYDLWQARTDKKISDVALVRVEEFYPFPEALLGQQLARYPNAEVVWCQEEPENMGAWQFVDRRIEGVLTAIKHNAKRPRYVGRPPAASPATGLLAKHNAEQAKLLDEALIT